MFTHTQKEKKIRFQNKGINKTTSGQNEKVKQSYSENGSLVLLEKVFRKETKICTIEEYHRQNVKQREGTRKLSLVRLYGLKNYQRITLPCLLSYRPLIPSSCNF
jgi:hypothetical protein